MHAQCKNLLCLHIGRCWGPLCHCVSSTQRLGQRIHKACAWLPRSVASHPVEVQPGAALQTQCPHHGPRRFVKAFLDWVPSLWTRTSKLHLLVTRRHLYALQSITPVSLVPSDAILNTIHTYYNIIDYILWQYLHLHDCFYHWQLYI